MINVTLPLTSCDAKINISKLLITQNKFRSTILALKKGIRKFLSYEKAIKDYAVKKLEVKEVLQRDIRQLRNKNICYFWGFVIFVSF